MSHIKHFVGGFGLGMFLGLWLFAPGEHKFAASIISGVLLGLAAWGLL